MEYGYIRKGSIIIVESVERACINRLRELKFERNEFKVYGNRADLDYSAKKPMKLSLFDICSFIRLRLGYNRPYRVIELSQDYFTHPFYSDKLFFLDTLYDSDLGFIQISDNAYYSDAIGNLVKLHNFATKLEIKFYYMICADKYDAYSEYTINNPFPLNPTFNHLNNIDSTWFINSKVILQKHIRAGEKDIYRLNDTHWSPIASKYIAEHIAKIMNAYK